MPRSLPLSVCLVASAAAAVLLADVIAVAALAPTPAPAAAVNSVAVSRPSVPPVVTPVAPAPTAKPPARTSPSPAPTRSRPAPAPPVGQRQRVLFSVGPDVATAAMRSARADGREDRLRPSARRLLRTQVSERHDLAVRVKVIKQEGGFYGGGGCTVAGCPVPAYSGQIEQGIEVERLSTGRKRLLTKGGSDVAPALSPDGTLIAYLSHIVRKDIGGEQDVVALTTPSGRDYGPLVLPPRDQTDSAPVWAPNGKAVATIRTRVQDGKRISSIVVLPVDGREPRVVAEGSYQELSWSPNGSTLVAKQFVERTVDGLNYSSGSDLWLVDVASGRSRRLTRFAPTPTKDSLIGGFCGAGGGYQVGVRSPVWSPDGRYVAFLSSFPHEAQLGRHEDVMSVEVKTGRVRTVHRTPLVTCPEPARYLQTALYGWIS